MNASQFKKIIFSLTRLITSPLRSLSWVRRGHLLVDRSIIDTTYWFQGNLLRRSLIDVVPETKKAEVILPRAFDRTFGTSITTHEACALAAIVRALHPAKVLEIGTFDGNTTLLFAANLEGDGSVATVDLPPDFDSKRDRGKLGHDGVKINLTPRTLVAGQYREDPRAQKITQIFGDSASLDWKTFGGPFNLIFIDGCHTEIYVRTDSQNAVSVIAPGGAIVWHDYGVIPDVSRAVDAFALEHPEFTMCVIEGTRLALGIRKAK